MGFETGILWTNKTWNPWHGCHKISPGCKNCYMFSDKKRYGQDGNVVVRSKTTFRDPFKWKAPALVFTCSWSDWFIEEADEWRGEAYEIIRQTPHLTYQILTKRIDRAPAHWHWAVNGPPPNAWLGVSVEDRQYGLPRIDILRELPAALRFLSIEPLLEDIGELDLRGIGWVIIGGESGIGARMLSVAWVRDIIAQCRAAGVPVFVKQLGRHPFDVPRYRQAPPWPGEVRWYNATEPNLGDHKGGDIEEWPEDLRVRQFPVSSASGGAR